MQVLYVEFFVVVVMSMGVFGLHSSTIIYFCRASRVAQWSKAMPLAMPLEILGLSPGSVAAGHYRETHWAVHNWPSVIWVRGGFGRQGCPCALTTPVVGRV